MWTVSYKKIPIYIGAVHVFYIRRRILYSRVHTRAMFCKHMFSVYLWTVKMHCQCNITVTLALSSPHLPWRQIFNCNGSISLSLEQGVICIARFCSWTDIINQCCYTFDLLLGFLILWSLFSHTYAHTHTHMHTHSHRHIHTRTHTDRHTCTHTHTHTAPFSYQGFFFIPTNLS